MEDNQIIEEDITELENSDEMKRYAELARAAGRRGKTPQPDVMVEWGRFCLKHGAAVVKRHRPRAGWRTLRDIAIGAAAMFAIMLAYNHYFVRTEKTAAGEKVTAMKYDKRPQTVTLQHEKGRQNLTGRDSMSFVRVAVANVERSNDAVEAEVKPQQRTVSMQTLSTPRGMDFKVLLPDGSEVWLNAESTIEFPSAFIGNERIVRLKGEAYFKVMRNEQQPFIVHTDKMDVKVIGTEFNFKNYKAETPHVSLVNGKVEVMHGATGEVAACLQPGQDAWVDGNGSMHVREIDTYAVTQWIRGFFYFDDMPLVDILRELSRWYNCGVVFNNRSSMNYRLHFSASRNADLGQTIDNLNKLCKSKIVIDGNNLMVN